MLTLSRTSFRRLASSSPAARMTAHPAATRAAFGMFAVLLFAALLAVVACLPTSAYATPEDGDQSLLTQEELAAALASGELDDGDALAAEFALTAEDGEDGEGGEGGASLAYDASKKLYSVYGENRYETSAQTALAGWDCAERAILTTGENWVDALAISGLAGALDCPVLLVRADALPTCIAEALSQLGVESVIVVGGVDAVGTQVEYELAELGIAVEKRVAGEDRFGTAHEIYAYGSEQGLWAHGAAAVVASGADGGFADALSMASAAYAQCYPVFLVDADGNLPEALLSDVTGGMESGIIENVLIAGGTERVSEETEGLAQQAAELVGGEATRLGGEDRYETSAKIAAWATENGLLSWDDAAVATGSKPYDALGGGALQGHRGSVLLLADVDKTADAVGALKGQDVQRICFFGGASACPMEVRIAFADGLGFSTDDIERVSNGVGFVYLDAGHGLNSSNDNKLDVGAVGSGYLEYKLNNELANLVGDILTDEYGIDVYVNDDGGWFKLRQAEAERLGCDLFVSIHFNASDYATATGTETYIHSIHAAEGSDILQEEIHGRLVKALGLADRGMKDAEFAVCGGNVPATLLEICFISNADDMKTYQARKDAVAHAIAAGIAASEDACSGTSSGTESGTGDEEGATPIMGSSQTTIARMVERFEQSGYEFPSDVYTQYGAEDIEEFCTILYNEAEAEGVRAEVVFAQAMVETGWLQFGGDVQAEQCNFAGLGATGGVPGNSFNDWGANSVRKGLRAQVQHLKAYASTDELNRVCVDVRFGYVTRGCAPTVEELSCKWAAGDTYGNKIVAIMKSVL